MNHLPDIAAILHRSPHCSLESIFRYVKPDVLINIGHRHEEIIPAAKRAAVPMRIAIPRGLKQARDATHRIWAKRSGSPRHESQHILDFLKPLGFSAQTEVPPAPCLILTPEEVAQGQLDLQGIGTPRLGIVTRGSGGGAFPSFLWWQLFLESAKNAGWNPVILSPQDECCLPTTNLRGLMGRLKACDALLGISTGPTHLAAALDVPTLCLMGRRTDHAPHRWRPLGNRVTTLQYPGKEDDFGSGMDRLLPTDVLAVLEKMR
jgi:ADP-heptose:LPS heptosyltransferase